MFRTVLPPRHYPYDVFLKSGRAPTNKIQTMQRQSYGSRDQEFLKLKIYAIHKATYALVGWTPFHFINTMMLQADEP